MLLAEELGVEPGPELRRLNEQVLQHDVSFAPSFGAVADTAVAPSPTASPSRRHASFVGREAALEVLERAARDSVTGRTRIVLVNGEAGIGKTTLVEELAARLATSGAVVCWGRCHDDEGAPPMWPWCRSCGHSAKTHRCPVRSRRRWRRCPRSGSRRPTSCRRWRGSAVRRHPRSTCSGPRAPARSRARRRPLGRRLVAASSSSSPRSCATARC